MIDVNVYQENIFHTKMILKEFDLTITSLVLKRRIASFGKT